MTFTRWSWKILKKWIWLLGLVPQLLDFLVAYIPRQYIPSAARSLLEKGADWRLTLVLVCLLLLVSAFLLHVEDQRTLHERDWRIRELENRQPHIVVGFRDRVGHLSQRLRIELPPLPPSPDFDAFVDEKRTELLAKQAASKPADSLLSALRLGQPNPRFTDEIERYLPKYRAYLVRLYERTLAEDRTIAVTPMVENQGSCPANDVTVEFAVPGAYRKAARHQLLEVSDTDEQPPDELELSEEKRLEDDRVCGLPEEPEPTIGVWASRTFLPLWAT